jgi:hypothetical protein
MRPQEIAMTQRRYFSPKGAPRDSAPAETPHNSNPRTLRGNHVPQYAVGTPEHSALVDAVRREFPEIFDSQANRDKAERS